MQPGAANMILLLGAVTHFQKDFTYLNTKLPNGPIRKYPKDTPIIMYENASVSMGSLRFKRI